MYEPRFISENVSYDQQTQNVIPVMYTCLQKCRLSYLVAIAFFVLLLIELFCNIHYIISNSLKVQ